MRFICDAMLGKLAKYLRILGLDAPYVHSPVDFGKPMFSEGQYHFLTRRSALRSHPNVVFIRSDRVRAQIREIRSIIRASVHVGEAMSRCIACNLPLVDVSRTEVEGCVAEFVYHHYETFKACPLCGKVYWEGSHAAHMRSFIEEIFGEEDGKRR